MTKGLMVGLSVCEKKISILISFFEITLGMLKFAHINLICVCVLNCFCLILAVLKNFC